MNSTKLQNLKNSSKKITKIISVFLLFTLILGMFSFGSSSSFITAASEIDDLQNKYDNLEKEHNKIKEELKKIQSDKNNAQKQSSILKSEITLTQQQIDILNDKIDKYNNIISAKELEIKNKEAEINSYYETFKKRLRAMYVTNTSSMLSMVLGADDFSDFLTKTEFVKKTSQHDRDLLKQLNVDKQAIEKAKTSIQGSKKEIESSKASVDSKQNYLETKLGQNQQLASSLASSEEQKKSQQQKLTDEMNKINAEIERIIRESQVDNDFVGGDWAWPVPGYRTVTSKFGWRVINGVKDYHTGIDIAGANVYGKNIVAANDGVVSYVKNQSSGYGKHLLVDHGGGNFTLYAHTSAILVSPGQKVKKGQPIARVGSTGWSTGPHLHFEIWINKQRVDPYQFY